MLHACVPLGVVSHLEMKSAEIQCEQNVKREQATLKQPSSNSSQAALKAWFLLVTCCVPYESLLHASFEMRV